MIDNILYVIYLILSYMPDIRLLDKFFKKIRAYVLSLQSNKEIGSDCEVSCRVIICKSTKLILCNNVEIKNNVILGGKIIRVGKNSRILSNTTIDGTGGVCIGSWTQIGRNVHIYSHSHDVYSKSLKVIHSKKILKPVKIGDDVMLFSKVSVLSGVIIADGSVIAHGAIVVKDTIKFGIYAGVPAKLLDNRR